MKVALYGATGKSEVGRLLVAGGAGGLEVAPGVSLIQSGYLPQAYLPIANSHANAPKVLQNSDIDWTCFAPPAFFEPGQRTGKLRLGTYELIRTTSTTAKSRWKITPSH